MSAFNEHDIEARILYVRLVDSCSLVKAYICAWRSTGTGQNRTFPDFLYWS